MVEKTPKDLTARQDPGCRIPEDGADVKHTYSSEVGTAKIDWHLTGMPDERTSMENFRSENS